MTEGQNRRDRRMFVRDDGQSSGLNLFSARDDRLGSGQDKIMAFELAWVPKSDNWQDLGPKSRRSYRQ
jgi:hypothetical protein